MLFPVVFTGCFAIAGFLAGRWVAVLAAAAVMPLYWGGLHAGWWGYGVGESWQPLLVFTTVLATFGAAIGVAARRWLRSS
ncbi:MAG: hypothetical protein M3P42_06905 [Actinomycetota bacterium]|nr:hypothetical protein [Actinomycetota bacterium]